MRGRWAAASSVQVPVVGSQRSAVSEGSTVPSFWTGTPPMASTVPSGWVTRLIQLRPRCMEPVRVTVASLVAIEVMSTMAASVVPSVTMPEERLPPPAMRMRPGVYMTAAAAGPMLRVVSVGMVPLLVMVPLPVGSSAHMRSWERPKIRPSGARNDRGYQKRFCAPPKYSRLVAPVRSRQVPVAGSYTSGVGLRVSSGGSGSTG